MTFVKRASAAAFALAFVAFVLIVGHQLSPGSRSHADRNQSALERTQTTLFDAIAIDRVEPPKREDSSAPSRHNDHNRLIASEEPAGPNPPAIAKSPPPRPLPLETDATPIAPEGPELPPVASPQPSSSEPVRVPNRESEPKSAMNSGIESDDTSEANSSADSRERKIIEKGLPGSTAEERDLWHDIMKDLPANDLLQLLRVRKELGGLPHRGSELLRRRIPQVVSSRQQSIDPGKTAAFPDALPGSNEELGSQQIVQQTFAAIADARHVILNNIANLNTVAFKRSSVSFESAVEDSADRTAISTDNSSRATSALRGLGARMTPPQLDLSQGHVQQSGRRLDVAIEGAGFFQLKALVSKDSVLKASGTKRPAGDNDKIFYTRAGRFSVDADGRVVLRTSKTQWTLEPPVAVPPGCSEIHVSETGEIRAVAPPDGEWTIVGALELARFSDPSELVPCGENVYCSVRPLDDDRVGAPNSDGLGRIRQGALESSNVDLRQELKELEEIEQYRQALEQAARLLPGMTNSEARSTRESSMTK